jgi:transcriptional regulator with XRE-family HTH domain
MVEAVSAAKLGARLHEVRLKKGLTLEDLAERSGVSRAMLSKLERGEKNPTLVVAARIAQGLDTPLTSLLGVDEERRRVVVTPRERQAVFRDSETGFERHVLSPPFERRTVELVRHVIPEGASSGDLPPYRRGVEKHLVVERGRLEVTIGGESYRLGVGDALFFEADVTHRFANAGRGTCSYVLVVSASP